MFNGKWIILVVCMSLIAMALVYMSHVKAESPPLLRSSSSKNFPDTVLHEAVPSGNAVVSAQHIAGSGIIVPVTSNEVKLVATTVQSRAEFSDAAMTNRQAWGRERWRQFQERLEKLKETDPEQYKAIIASREAARQKIQAAFAEKAAYLLSVDTSSMTEEESANYAKMTQILGQMWELSQRMQTDLTPEERQQLRTQLRQDTQTLDPLLLAQRDKEWLSIGQQAGYSPDDARAFADYLNKVTDMTSMRNSFPNMRNDALTPEQQQNNTKAMQAALAEKAAYFSSIDTSAMTADEKLNHDKLVQAFGDVQQAAQRLVTVTPDERRNVMGALWDGMRTLDPLLTAQRNTEWYNAGIQLGYSQDAALAFADYLNKVIDITSTRAIMQNMRSGGMPLAGTVSTPANPGK